MNLKYSVLFFWVKPLGNVLKTTDIYINTDERKLVLNIIIMT